LISQLLISGLFHYVLAEGKPGIYFVGSGITSPSSTSDKDRLGREGDKGKERIGAWREIWLSSSLFEGLSGFVLGWAGVGGVIR
jgi:ER membrane protein complex subunit 6